MPGGARPRGWSPVPTDTTPLPTTLVPDTTPLPTACTERGEVRKSSLLSLWLCYVGDVMELLQNVTFVPCTTPVPTTLVASPTMFTPLDTACANILDYSSKYFCDFSDYALTLPSAPKGLQVTLSLRLGGPGGGPWPLLATPPAGAEPLAGFWSAGVCLAGAGACTCTRHSGLRSAVPAVWRLVTWAGGAGAWLTVPALCSLPCLPGAGGWPSPEHSDL